MEYNFEIHIVKKLWVYYFVWKSKTIFEIKHINLFHKCKITSYGKNNYININVEWFKYFIFNNLC